MDFILSVLDAQCLWTIAYGECSVCYIRLASSARGLFTGKYSLLPSQESRLEVICRLPLFLPHTLSEKRLSLGASFDRVFSIWYFGRFPCLGLARTSVIHAI